MTTTSTARASNSGTRRARRVAVEPWLPLEKDYQQRNVAVLQAEDNSIYRLHRKLIALRRRHRALHVGGYRPIAANGDVLAFVREAGDEKILVALNLGPEPTELIFPADAGKGRLLLSSIGDRDGERIERALALRPNEGVVVEVGRMGREGT